MEKMTRHEKKKYYKELEQIAEKYVNLMDYITITKYQIIIRIINSYDEKYVKRVLKDSKLSSLKNGMLRTIDKVDKSYIKNDKKVCIIKNMIDVYYNYYVNIETQIRDEIIRNRRIVENEYPGYMEYERTHPRKIISGLEYQTLCKTRKIKFKK